MAILGRLLATIGIGSAKIDTVLEKSAYVPDEEIRGVVRIQGGTVEQQIDGLYLSLLTSYIREAGDSKIAQTAEIAQIRITERIQVGAGEEKEVPFAFVLPGNTPLTLNRTPVWIKTTADIDSAMDPTDEDGIHVRPTSQQRVVLEAFEQIGFRLRNAQSVYAPRLGFSLPFVQEFEWVPAGGKYRGRLDEVELVFLHAGLHGLELLLQVDLRKSGLKGLLSEARDTDDTFARLSISPEELGRGAESVAATLDQVISRYSR